MDIREIQYILTIIEEGNMTKAAKKLYIAQSSLSQSLKKTEQQLGCKLFTRIGSNLKLTYAGERFVQLGSEIVKNFRDMENEMSDIAHMERGNITIGITYYLGSYMFPIFGPVFQKYYPNISVKLIERSSKELEELIALGHVDMAILPLPLENKLIEYDTLFSSRMILLMSKDNPMNNHGYKKDGFRFPYIDIRLFDKTPFIMGFPGQRIRLINEIIFEKANINPKIVFMTRNLETTKRMSCADTGFAIIPDKYLDFIQTNPNLRCYYIEDKYDYQFEVVIAYRKNTYITDPTKEFLSIVKNLF